MHFEKVSYEEWEKAWNKVGNWLKTDLTLDARQVYNSIKLPKQGTARSMGMDFFAPFGFSIYSGNSEIIPTGIRWVTNPIDDNVGLMIVPRSGLGFKYGVRLENTVGIIDADYCEADNEGHIMVKLHNPSNNTINVEAGKGFVQGIVTDFYICEGAESDESRFGGFGSTG